MTANMRESQLLVVTGTLIEAAADKDEAVRDAVMASLRKLAKKYPSDVLRHAVNFRQRNLKISTSHLSTLLRTMELICQDHIAEIDGDVVLSLISFATEEMTRSSEYLPASQMPSSGILVALGKAHCNEVMDGLLKYYEPGVVPHYSVVHTMGSLASANVFGIVPFIKATVGTMLPMMGMLRNDAMKQAFSYALGKFSEAISDYLANIDHAPDPTVKVDMFSSEISIAYDILANTWLHIREQKVCENVLQAIGPMFALLPQQKVSEQIPRLIPTLLSLYRRNTDPRPITQCLATVLLVAVSSNKSAMEPFIENLLSSMFDLVCTAPDYAQPLTVKNHYEVLRCFDTIASYFTDRVVDLLIQQLRNNNDRERVRALIVMTHLVNSSESIMRPRLVDLTSSLRNMLGEQNIKVKKVLLKAIGAFSYHGCMEGNEGKDFFEFIVKHCCSSIHQTVGKESDSFSLVEEFRGVCCNTLYLLATTVPEIEDMLWPLLLQFLLAVQYTDACAVITRCLAHLASKRKDDIQKSSSSDIPDYHLVYGRCLALLGNPLESNRGHYTLVFIKNYVCNVNKYLKPLWEMKIPELLTHLEDYKDSWDDSLWEDLVLEFLTLTLKEVDEEIWTTSLGCKLAEQAPLYTSYPVEQGMLYKCLAVVMCRSSDTQFVHNHLDIILCSMRQHSLSEAKVAARAVGICSRKHLETVLHKLDKLTKDELSRKSSRLLGFMKDVKHESEVERVRLTLLLCYGEVALEAPGTELLPKMEHSIVNWVVEQLQTIKDVTMKEVALKTLGNVAEAYHPNRNSLHIILFSRSDILNAVLAHFNTQLPLSDFHIYSSILQVITSLIKLAPPLTSDERFTVLKLCFSKVFQVVVQTSVVEVEKDFTWPEPLANILFSLGTLVQELLVPSVTPAALDDIFSLLEPYLSERNSLQRLAAMGTLVTILQCYVDNIKFTYDAPSKFGQTGFILGHIIPRCIDPNITLRQKAVDCVQLILCLAAHYQGCLADHDNDFTSTLARIRKDICTTDPNKLFIATGELGKVICAKLPPFQLMHFCESLLDGLLDSQSDSSNGTSVILNVLLKTKGGELYHHVNDIVFNLLKRLENISCTQTRTGSVRAILSLAGHHLKAVVLALMCQPLPYESCVSDCWKMLAQEPGLSADIIEQFLQLISCTPFYEEQQDKSNSKIAVLQPLAAISAMKDMFRINTMEQIAINRFPELFSTFYVALCCYVGVFPPIYIPQSEIKKEAHTFIPNRNAYKMNPARVAEEAFKSFLLCAKYDALAEALLHCSNNEPAESINSVLRTVPSLARALCICAPQSLPKVITVMNRYSTSSSEPQRIAVAALYAELINCKCCSQMVLVESTVTNLLNCLTDPSSLVRQLCLRGLSHVSQLEAEQRNRYTGSTLSALVQGLDDQDNVGDITVEAVRGLSKMLAVVTEEQVRGIQLTVALRIKPYFEREDSDIREGAIRVFGDLARFGGVSSKNAFQEQVYSNLVSFLLHLNDADDGVVKSCKCTLRQVSPFLEAEKVKSMMQDHLIDGANLHYADFMADLSKILIEELPDLVPNMIISTLSYVKSPWPIMRANAAMFIGLLCGNLPPEESVKVKLDIVCARLLLLLKDEDRDVRAKTAKALSYLFVL